MEELKAFLQEQLRNKYDIKESQIEVERPGLMREAERFLFCSKLILYGVNICKQWMHCANQLD